MLTSPAHVPVSPGLPSLTLSPRAICHIPDPRLGIRDARGPRGANEHRGAGAWSVPGALPPGACLMLWPLADKLYLSSARSACKRFYSVSSSVSQFAPGACLMLWPLAQEEGGRGGGMGGRERGVPGRVEGAACSVAAAGERSSRLDWRPGWPGPRQGRTDMAVLSRERTPAAGGRPAADGRECRRPADPGSRVRAGYAAGAGAGDGSDGMDRATLRGQPVQGPRGSGEVEAGDDAGGEGGARGADVLEVVGEGLDGDALRRGEELLRRRRRRRIRGKGRIAAAWSKSRNGCSGYRN